MRKTLVRLLATTVIGFVTAGGVALVGASAASAAPSSSYGRALYQITWSLNCDNRAAACAFDPTIGLGGFWGWVALMPSSTPGTGADNGQETVCGHSLVPGAGPGGALHAPIDSTWNMISAPPVLPAVDPNGNYLVINDTFGLFPVPATPGHYKVSVEGATGEITVAP